MFRVIVLMVVGFVAAIHGPAFMETLVANASKEDGPGSPYQSKRTPFSSDVRDSRAIGGTMVLKAAANGHYYTTTKINGRPVDVMVDTGATAVALRYEDARAIGILLKPSDFTIPIRTANGESRAAPITLKEVRLGSIRVGNVDGMVIQQGQLGITLLGMTFINKLSRADMRSGELILAP